MHTSTDRYATIYTMAPVFSMVLDEDVSPDIALTYPELYRELMKVGGALERKFGVELWSGSEGWSFELHH